VLPLKNADGNPVAVVCNAEGYFADAFDEAKEPEALHMQVHEDAQKRVLDRQALSGGKDVPLGEVSSAEAVKQVSETRLWVYNALMHSFLMLLPS
jgi:hypothetical protein